ncbi:MAG: exo-alpha-sialidase [Patescibacteria group bacterium]|nr:exo-alpha-sialidase [Patescibacteria group bacterium]
MPVVSNFVSSFPVNITGQVSSSLFVDGECTCAVDPASGTPPQNFFASAHYAGNTNICFSSQDGGNTWTRTNTSSLFVNKPCGADGVSVYDGFGNLFFVYLLTGQLGIELAVSTDGGQSFLPHGKGSVAVAVNFKECDNPAIAVGPPPPSYPGNPVASVWVSAYANGYGAYLFGAPVYGAGNVGSFANYRISNASNWNDSSVSVGPAGQVFATFSTGYNANMGGGPNQLKGVLIEDGLFGRQISTFNIPGAFAEATNVGVACLGQVFLHVQPQPRRGIQPKVRVAWQRSQNFGRVYVAFLDRAGLDPETDVSVYVIYSDDQGTTWSAPQAISYTGSTQLNVAIAVDQSTENVGVSWYDARDVPANNAARVYYSISTNHGYSWTAPAPMGIAPSSGLNADQFNYNFEFGDFDDMSYVNGTLFRAWGDNSGVNNVSPPNAFSDGQHFALAVSRVTKLQAAGT